MHFIFDVDGTITPSRDRIDEDFRLWFLDFAKWHNVYLVTGSDQSKTVEQIGEELFAKVECVYNSSGNTKHKNGVCVFNTKDLELPRDAYAFLLKKSISTDFDIATGNHFESRPGLLNFSIVGRNANREQRKKYVEFDNLTNERQTISDEFNKKFTKKLGLVSQVAGETGLDIIEMGKDKAQILKDFTFQDELMFFGDNIQPGGNDYGIAQAIKYGPYKYSECHNVKSWKETWKILKKI
jgi:phosphomannomutase